MSDLPKVVSIRDGCAIHQPGEVVPSVVQELERALEMARVGEIIGVTVVYDHADEMVTGSTKGLRTRAAVGMIEIIKADLVDWLRT